MSTDVERIKQALDIVDVIGEYVRLKQSGANWKGLCPFHGEKSPSFMVHREKQLWHCFGCSVGGDMFEFVKKIENVEFPEALEILARKAGVELTRQAPGENNKRLRLFQIIEVAKNFFIDQLQHSSSAVTARAYIESRKITVDSIKEFEIGYSLPEWDKLIIWLRSKGFSLDEIMTAGLALKSERGPGAYDRFRDRLMFPINDAQGRTIGFGGRTLQTNAKEAKYINSPQTPIYDKSSIVYNLDRAKNYIKEVGYVILVEGYMDVVGSSQASVKNVVATSGTALTQAQVKLLKRYTDDVRVCFDADLAGRNASERGIDLLLQAEIEVKIITLPFGKDPDECARQDAVAYQNAVKNALSIGDHAFKTVLSEVDVTTREGKKQAAERLLKVFAKLPDPVERDHYIKRLSREIGIDERSIREKFFIITQKSTIFNSAPSLLPDVFATASSTVSTREEQVSERLISLLMLSPQTIPVIIDRFNHNMLVGVKSVELYKYFIVQYNERHCLDIEEIKQELLFSSELTQFINTLELQASSIVDEQPALDIAAEIKDLSRALTIRYLQNEKKRLSVIIRQAEAQQDTVELAKLVDQFTIISRQLSSL